MRLLFLIGIVIVIVGALPFAKDVLPSAIPISGNNYQYLIMILGGVVAVIGLLGVGGDQSRSRVARALGFKE